MIDLIIEGRFTVADASAEDAASLRGALEENIESAELGDIVVGGCDMDTGVFDIRVRTAEADKLQRFLAEILKEAELDDEVELSYSEVLEEE
jgi:hypothetical protein